MSKGPWKKKEGETAVLERALTPEEMAATRAELERVKTMQQATAEFQEGTNYSPVNAEEFSVNKDKLKHEEQRLQRVLDEKAPKKITSEGEGVRIEARMKWLQDQFIPYLETFHELNLRHDSQDPDFRQAVEKGLSRHKVDHYIQEWKELAKRRWPNDTEMQRLDRFRSRS